MPTQETSNELDAVYSGRNQSNSKSSRNNKNNRNQQGKQKKDVEVDPRSRVMLKN